MSYQLLHYSDPHFGACDPHIAQVAVEMAHELKPDLTVVSGDFSMRGRRFEFELARDWLKQLPTPLITLPGNHDVPGLNHILDRFFSPFGRYREYIAETEEPTFSLGEIGALATANSSTPFGLHFDWSRGFLSPMRLHTLANFFAEIDPGKLRVFGMHHPVVGSGEKERALVAPLSMVKNFFETSKIDLLLAGHFHQSKICLFPLGGDSPQNVVVSQAPSICSTRLKGEPNGFHRIQLSADRIEIELWRWRGQDFQAESASSFQRIENSWASAP
jgi:3',5'-cyclic AMP phosphodiesterase CpdA